MTPDAIIPNAIWAGRGSGRDQRIRIVDTRSDGRVVFVRTAGAPPHALHREVTVPVENLRAAFEPTGDFEHMAGL